MSKAKKTAYSDKEKAATVVANARQLTPVTENAAMPKTAKPSHGRKQSRGK